MDKIPLVPTKKPLKNHEQKKDTSAAQDAAVRETH